jgi:hypothetical protein
LAYPRRTEQEELTHMAIPIQAAPPKAEPDAEAPRGRITALVTSTPVVAISLWLVAAPIAFVVPTLQRFDPTRVRSWSMVLAPLFLAVAVMTALALYRRSRWLVPVAAAGLAAWTVFMLRVAVRGTPIAWGGLAGDAGRLTAAATRYESSPTLADAWIPGLTAEYPPLFPWLVGRTAALLDIPAWRLVGDFEILFVSLSVLVAFLLWQRLVPAWIAFAITVLAHLPMANPHKAYQSITLAIFIPWVLATFSRPPRGRLPWLASGLLAGFIMLTYYGWMIWGSFAIVALAVSAWRGEPDRAAYLRYLGKVVAVAAVVASWYVVPYLWSAFTKVGQTVGDLNPGPEMNSDVFSFLDGAPYLLIAILQVIGFLGLVWLRKSVWWAPPLLGLFLSALLFRFVFTAYFVVTEHSALAGYTPRLYGTVLTVAGVLVVAHATPELVRRLELKPPREVVVMAVALLVAWAGYSFSKDWMPGSGGRYSDFTQLALREPRTDANRPYADAPVVPVEYFPVDAIRSTVERVYGASANTHVSLSADERLYAYLPWPGYSLTERAAAPARARIDDRYAEITKLVQTKDPAAFTSASANTAFGPIDVFVLRKGESGWEYLKNYGWGDRYFNEVFSPSQFSSSDWTVTDITGSNFVVIIRRP